MSVRLKTLCAVCCLLISPARGAEDTIDPVGQVVSARGSERLVVAGTDVEQRVRRGQLLGAGDRIETGRYGRMSLLLRDETQIRLQRNTSFVVEGVRKAAADEQPTVGRLLKGALWARVVVGVRQVTGLASANRIEVRTPTSTIGIRGTDGTFKSAWMAPARYLSFPVRRRCSINLVR